MLSADGFANIRKKSRNRSKIANGTMSVVGIDGRSTHAGRWKELQEQFVADLGGNLSEAQTAIVRRAVNLIIWLELRESDLASGKALDIGTYVTTTNSLRRLLIDLGLERKAKDITSHLQTPTHGKAA